MRFDIFHFQDKQFYEGARPKPEEKNPSKFSCQPVHGFPKGANLSKRLANQSWIQQNDTKSLP